MAKSTKPKESKSQQPLEPTRSANPTQMIRAPVQPELKQQAEAVLKDVGLTPSQAIRLFYKQVVLRQGLPFEVKVPNAETRQALRDVEQKRGLTRYQDTEQMYAKLGL